MTSIGVIGVGSLGSSLIRAVARFAPEVPLHAASRDRTRLETLRRDIPQLALGTPEEVARSADLLFSCVPNAVYLDMAARVGPVMAEGAVFACVTNAVSLASVAEHVARPVVKVVPTLAQAVGRGVTLVVPGPGLPEEKLDAVLAVLARFSLPMRIDPADDRVAANVAGSGIALVAAMAENFVSANLAKAEALDRATLDAMMAETLSAVGELVKSGHSWRDIIAATATPGGMTDAALTVLAAEFPRLSRDMVLATFERQRALLDQTSA